MRKELNEMCDLLEAKSSGDENAELIESARFTAEMNPVSESAYDMRDALMVALMENR